MAAPAFDSPAAPRVWVMNAPVDTVTVPDAGGSPAAVYSTVGALPDGLRFDPATRRLSGTPSTAGAGAVTVRAANAHGAADWVMDYEIDPAAVQRTCRWFESGPDDGVNYTAFRGAALPAALFEGDVAAAFDGAAVVFGLYLNLRKLTRGVPTPDFKPAVEKDAILRFSTGGEPRLAVRLGGGVVPDTDEPYFLAHPPISGRYGSLAAQGRRNRQSPIVFSVHHPLLAAQGEPAAAALNGAAGTVAAALSMAPPTVLQPVAAALDGAAGTVAAALTMTPAPPARAAAAALDGAAGTVAAALTMTPIRRAAAALDGAAGAVAAALTLGLPVAPPVPLAPGRTAAARVVTAAGDVLDALCWRHYGRDAAETVPAVLAANPGLADADPVLPAGLVVELPELPAPAPRPAVRLWGPK